MALRKHRPANASTQRQIYTALLLRALGVPRSLFPALFAVGAPPLVSIFEQEKGEAASSSHSPNLYPDRGLTLRRSLVLARRYRHFAEREARTLASLRRRSRR